MTPEPPVLAANAPRMIKKMIADPYNVYLNDSKGRNNVANKGNTPPAVKAAPDANAA